MRDHTIKTITWAVDLDGDTELLDQTARILRPLLATTHAKLDPVFVLSPRSRIAPQHLPLWEKPFRELAEKRITGLASRCELPGIGRPVVLLDPAASLRQAAAALVSEAKSRGADLIAVSTHARKGVPRFFLGSFAETLLLQSTIPVLTVNPTARASERISRILFPSEFGQASRRAFEATVALSKQFGAKIWLYHKLPTPPAVSFPETPVLYQYILEAEEPLKKTAKAWQEWGRQNGADVTLAFDDAPGDVTPAILAFAKDEKIDLITMTAQSGPVASVLLGSVARQLVRQAECPVWIQHVKD